MLPKNSNNAAAHVIAHNIRSVHNVGSLFRTCEGLGVHMLWLTGYTPYPPTAHDARPPHVRHKLARELHKTALGAEQLVAWQYRADVLALIGELQAGNIRVLGLEQSAQAAQLTPAYRPPQRWALLLGEEVAGIDEQLQQQCDALLEIPMRGHKESFNVSVAAGMALFVLTGNQPAPHA